MDASHQGPRFCLWLRCRHLRTARLSKQRAKGKNYQICLPIRPVPLKCRLNWWPSTLHPSFGEPALVPPIIACARLSDSGIWLSGRPAPPSMPKAGHGEDNACNAQGNNPTTNATLRQESREQAHIDMVALVGCAQGPFLDLLRSSKPLMYS